MDTQDEEVALLDVFILVPNFLLSQCTTYSSVWSLLACFRLAFLATLCSRSLEGERKERESGEQVAAF